MSLEAWQDALTAAALLAVAPSRVGGVVLRARAGPVRDRVIQSVRALLPEGAPVRRVPRSMSLMSRCARISGLRATADSSR